ncbi:MAG: SusC/RagA family TonB-linked outer membrane protein [Marinilabiliales bacterium]|nr:MAG: SusC/RagA family TonB-linked outer membrane protein [Marinilabiliales bacterium]
MKKFLPLLFLFCSVTLFGQESIITGIVTAEEGYTLPGVNIIIKGTQIGTVSDQDGAYSIGATPESILQFSYIGMQSIEIMVGSQTQINVTLLSESETLQDVVVIGYGTVKKKDLTGSVSQVKAEEIAATASISPALALQGQSAGVQVVNNGLPGSTPEVIIRGIGSIQAGTQPLYVVDGVITNDIRNLSNDDILTMDILKDASSQAIYGARASNGVVMITTKAGAKGKMKLTYSGYYGINVIANRVEMATSQFYEEYTNEALARENKPPAFTGDTYPVNTVWLDEVTRMGQMISQSVSMSGGTEEITYLASFSYNGEKGVLQDNNFSRYTFRLNNDYKIAKWLTMGNILSLSTYKSDNPNTGVYNTAYRQAPNMPVYDSTGNWANSIYINNVGNPVATLAYWNNMSKGYKIQASFWADADIYKELSFKSSFGLDVGNDQFKNYNPTYYASASQQNLISNLTITANDYYHYTWDNMFNYNKSFKGKNNLDATAGITMEEMKSTYLTGYRSDVPPQENYWYLNLGDAATATNGNGGDKWRRFSFVARAAYNYSGKYFLTATIRYEGSSRFSEENRWGVFPAFGAGWRISDENFMKDSKVISNLKLRASWGMVGNDNIPTNEFIYTITSGISYPFDELIQNGSTITDVKDPNLTWESSTGLDIGLDYGFLKDRLFGEIDYYNKTTKNLLYPAPLPAILGSTSYITNIAELKNQGAEFTINWRDNIKKDVSYNIGANFTYNKNEITNLANGLPIDGGSLGNGQTTTRTSVGQPVGSFWVYETDGLYQTVEDINATPHFPGTTIGDFKYKDNNGDGLLDNEDRIFVGSYQPVFYYGINFSMIIKQWDILINGFGNIGNKVYNGKKAQRWGGENIEASLVDRWTEANTDTDVPRASNAVPIASDYYVESGNFFRFNNITVGYSIPLNSKVISKLRVYLSAQNPYTIKSFSGYNPELPGGVMDSGIEMNPIPTTGKYLFGVNMNF